MTKQDDPCDDWASDEWCAMLITTDYDKSLAMRRQMISFCVKSYYNGVRDMALWQIARLLGLL